MNIVKNIRQALLTLPILLITTALQAEVVCKSGNENTAIRATTPTEDFTDNGDGTVLHKTTGLTWMRCALGRVWDGSGCSPTNPRYVWHEALELTSALNSGESDIDGDGAPGFVGHTDWRMPNTKELESIFEERCWNPAVNAAIFPGMGLTEWYASSTTHSRYSHYVWYVDFDRGFVWYAEKYLIGFEDVKHRYYVRLVRGGL